MPPTSQKNQPLTPGSADMDYGGNALRQQLSDETADERRKRLLGLSQSQKAGAQPPILNPGITGFFQAMGMPRRR